jgi:hypothetical protein
VSVGGAWYEALNVAASALGGSIHPVVLVRRRSDGVVFAFDSDRAKAEYEAGRLIGWTPRSSG